MVYILLKCNYSACSLYIINSSDSREFWPCFNACVYRELDNNNFNGTLHIDNVANLRRRVSNGDKILYTGNLQILSIMSNDIMNVDDYSSSDITNITTFFM